MYTKIFILDNGVKNHIAERMFTMAFFQKKSARICVLTYLYFHIYTLAVIHIS